jgi:hypothetical protein
MKPKTLCLAISILIFNTIRAQKIDSIIQRCSIIEETFEKSSMRNFLKTTTLKRNIIDQFNANNSKYAFLSIQNDDVIYASFKKGIWKIISNDEEFFIKDETLISKINTYSIKNTVYKTICPDNYVMYDASIGLQSFWIKKSSEIKFLYYSTKYDIFSLDDDSEKKIRLLLEINGRFKKSKKNRFTPAGAGIR